MSRPRFTITIRRWMALVVLTALVMGAITAVRGHERWRSAVRSARADHQKAIWAREMAEFVADEWRSMTEQERRDFTERPYACVQEFAVVREGFPTIVEIKVSHPRTVDELNRDLPHEVDATLAQEAAKKAAYERLVASTPWHFRLAWTLGEIFPSLMSGSCP